MQPPGGLLALGLTCDAHDVVLHVSGEIDLSSAPALARSLDHLRAAGHQQVCLHLGGVTFIDSSGLSALVTARNAGLDLVLIEPSPRVSEVITLGGLGFLLDHPRGR